MRFERPNSGEAVVAVFGSVTASISAAWSH